MDVYLKQFDVTLPDVGENNELSNKGILRIMQEIACVHSAYCGVGVNNAKDIGLAWVILNWKLKVFSRPEWNTTLNVRTWSSKQNHISFYRDFEITDEQNNLVAIATSKWILLDLNKGTFAKVSPEMAKHYTHVDKHVFDEPFQEKLREQPDAIFVKEYSVSKRDIDTNHHVNNLNYLDFAYEALPVNMSDNFDNVEIMYKHEAKLGDTLNIYFSKLENEYLITIKNKRTNELHCIVKLF